MTRRNGESKGQRRKRLPTELYDAASLYSETFMEPEYLLPELLLAVGLTLVAGRPKSFKTWLVLQLAVAVALGQKFLGRQIVKPGRVLFFEFDDGRRQLNQRLHVLLPNPDGDDEPDGLENITFGHLLRPLSKGGITELEAYLRQAREEGNPYQALIIDTYLALRSRNTKADWLAGDYQEIGALRQLCMDHQCAGILVHHMKKGDSAHIADQILGSTGIAAAVDGWMLVVDDQENRDRKVVDIRGRSIPETVLRIGFSASGSRPGVYVVDEGIELMAGPEGRQVVLLLKQGGPKTPAEIAEALNRPANNVYQLLRRLRHRGLVSKAGGKYAYPS